MPDTRAHDDVYCPDCGLQWVAATASTRPAASIRTSPSAQRRWMTTNCCGWRCGWPTAASEPDWSRKDYRMVRGLLGRLTTDCQDLYVALAQRAESDSQ
jgi:hypothetical protein